MARGQEATHLYQRYPESPEFNNKQPTLICSGRAIYFKWHFCSLNKSTLVTWINPLHPDSTPSHKSAWTVRSAGTRGGSAHPLLNGYRGKTQSRFWLEPRTSLPNKAGTCLSFPWPGTKQSRAAWPAWSSSSKKHLGSLANNFPSNSQTIHWLQGSHASS